MAAFFRRTVVCCLLISLLAGCAAAPTLIPTSTPEPTAVFTATLPPTDTPTPEPTATATATATVTETPAPTDTPEPTTTPAPETRSDGWTVYTMEEDGFTVALPPEWQRLEMDPAKMQAAVGQVAENNPEFSKMLTQQAQSILATGVSFYGFDLSLESVQSRFITNISILKAPLDVDVDLDVVAQLNVNQIEMLPGVQKPVENTAVELPAGDAHRLRYTMKMNMASGEETNAAFTQYIFLEDGIIYVMTMTTRADLLPGYATDFEKIAQSFSLEN